jgi:peptidoglycan hydrolase CwlO-like protein
MELLYFISGVLSVGVVYGVYLLRTVKSSHTDLLARHQSQSNISSIREGEFKQDLQDLHVLINDIQSNMEKDQYENLGNINKRIKELDTVVYGNLDKIDKSNQVFTKNMSDVFSEIQQLKNTVKVMAQDPNFTRTF